VEVAAVTRMKKPKNKKMVPIQKGELITIVSPAKSIETEHVNFAKELIESKGFRVAISLHCIGKHHYFSGTDKERAQDFQQALDDPEVKAVLCARGGYGCIQILHLINWTKFHANPKWIIGFSDITVLHQRILGYGISALHASMPLNFELNSTESIDSLFTVLKGERPSYTIQAHPLNQKGSAKGKLVGGNLSILYSLIGTDDEVDYTDTILFIEDVGEQIYHIDRIFYSLFKSGILGKIKGVLVGGMTQLKDTENPFGKSIYEVISSHISCYHIPLAFDFPAGHIEDNRALVLGENVFFIVNDSVTLNYIN
jgi:muramoyltetrapeptide carboxypeptidase